MVGGRLGECISYPLQDSHQACTHLCRGKGGGMFLSVYLLFSCFSKEKLILDIRCEESIFRCKILDEVVVFDNIRLLIVSLQQSRRPVNRWSLEFWYSLFTWFRHLLRDPKSGSNMNENVTQQFECSLIPFQNH